jgi:hypothetical protein
MSDSKTNDASPAIAVLQTAQHHHVSMTAMADQKASLLLAAALLTAALSLAAPHRPVAVALFATGLGTAFFAILAMMPRMLVLRDAERNKEVNLLFCGHFSDMQEDDYVAKVKALLVSPEDAVEALSRDLFQMGILVHQKKFRFLGHAYTVCVLGLMLTAALAFLGRMHLI